MGVVCVVPIDLSHRASICQRSPARKREPKGGVAQYSILIVGMYYMSYSDNMCVYMYIYIYIYTLYVYIYIYMY